MGKDQPVRQPRLLIFGLGYSAAAIAAMAAGRGWSVAGTTRDGRAGTIRFDDEPAVTAAITGSSHLLSSVPPADGRDPVLDRYGAAVAAAPAGWCGYLSSTGVYGDTGGAWVDETAPLRPGRRTARAEADRAWGALRADMRVFRLPGIYGPGRSAIERVRAGRAHRVDRPGQLFSRVHVQDLAAAVWLSMAGQGPPGAYNLADDVPAHGNAPIEEACRLLGRPLPPLIALDDPALSAEARGFWRESRRVAAGRARRLLGWRPRFPGYRAGLRAIVESEAMAPDSAAISRAG
jgi:nucleoside-diphosphate-sugar epimerase